MTRSYRRETRYGATLSISVEPSLKAALQAEADEADVSLGAVVRDALHRGLSLSRDARRKQDRKQSGKREN